MEMSLFKLSAKREAQDNVYDVANNNYFTTFVSVTVGSVLESNEGKKLKKINKSFCFILLLYFLRNKMISLRSVKDVDQDAYTGLSAWK